MYALQGRVRLEAGHEDEARAGLMSQLLPRAKSAPGFVAGYWLAPEEGGEGERGWTSTVLWDTKEHAEAMAEQLTPGSHPSPHVTIEQMRVREVIANI